MEQEKKYFWGFELSEKEVKKNRLSYYTLSRCFDAVLCNNIVEVDEMLFDNVISGDFEIYYNENGDEITYDEYLEDENAYVENVDVYQWFIVEDNAKDLLEDAGEIVLYSEKLDCYIWGVTHYGTSWRYVFTSIKIDEDKK